MKRKIKFRFWSAFRKTMYIHDLKDIWAEGCEQQLELGYGPTGRATDNTFPYIDMPVMMFTGLTDKNGKEIYEGDVLLVEGFEDRGDGQFDEVTFGVFWDAKTATFSTDINYELYELADDAEVVSNIYENPELQTEKTAPKDGLS